MNKVREVDKLPNKQKTCRTKCYLLSYLLGVIKVAARTVPLYQRCFKPQTL